MTGLSKKILLCLLSVALVTGTFLLDQASFASKEKEVVPDVTILEKGPAGKVKTEDKLYTAESGDKDRLVLLFGKNVAVRLDKNSSATFKIEKTVGTPRKILVNDLKGKVWVNTLNSEVPTEVTVSQIKLQLEPGIFDLRFLDGKINLAAMRRSAVAEFDGNELVVPEGNAIGLSAAEKDKLDALSYPDFAKKFPYVALAQPDDWASRNAKDDVNFGDVYRSNVDKEVRDAGQKLGNDKSSIFVKLGNFTNGINVALTFDPVRKSKKEVSSALNYLDAAVYNYSIGNNDIGDNFLVDFSNTVGGINVDDETLMTLRIKQDELAFNRPVDSSFSAKKAIREITKMAYIERLHAAFVDALDAAAAGVDTETKQRTANLLRQFGYLADTKIGTVKNSTSAGLVLFDYVRLKDFVNKNPTLFKEDFLNILGLYENAYLGIAAGGKETEDAKRFFVSEKIKKIQKIKNMLGDMDFQDGRKAILFLAGQIEPIKSTITDVSVISSFDGQMYDVASFLSFLRSSSSDNLHGSYDEAFANFQAGVDQMKKVTDLLAVSSGGEQISPSRREELASTASADLSGIGVTDLKIELPQDEGDSGVKITAAKLEEKPFTATYDTENKVFTNIMIDGEVVQNAIRLQNLKQFFLLKQGKVPITPGVTEDSLVEGPSQDSLLLKVAKAKLLDSFKALNILVEDKYLGFEDLDKDIVHIRLATVGQASDAKVFSFDLTQKMTVVTNLKVQTVAGELSVNDTFTLRELPTKVEQIYARALFEKQREEELQNFMKDGTIPGTSTEVQ
jgi:hypothetical protein